MKSVLTCLQEKTEAFDKMKQNYENTVTHIQVELVVGHSIKSKSLVC